MTDRGDEAGRMDRREVASDDRACRASGGRGPATRAGAPVGAHAALTAPVPPGMGSRAQPRGARGPCPGGARLLSPTGSPTGYRSGPHRDGDGRAAFRGRTQPQRALSHAGSRRGLRPGPGRAANVPRCVWTKRRRGGAGARHDPATGGAAPGPPRPPWRSPASWAPPCKAAWPSASGPGRRCADSAEGRARCATVRTARAMHTSTGSICTQTCGWASMTGHGWSSCAVTCFARPWRSTASDAWPTVESDWSSSGSGAMEQRTCSSNPSSSSRSWRP